MRDKEPYALKFLIGGNPYALSLFPSMGNRISSLVISENNFLTIFKTERRTTKMLSKRRRRK